MQFSVIHRYNYEKAHSLSVLSYMVQSYWFGLNKCASTRKKDFTNYSMLLYKECFSFLSKPHDAHVPREKSNLQDSPPHVFMNWADYQIIHMFREEISELNGKT